MAIKDGQKTQVTKVIDPIRSAVAITPHDTNELDVMTRAIYVGGAGNLVVTMADNVDATFYNVLAGTVLPIQIKRVKSTGNTATNILGMY